MIRFALATLAIAVTAPVGPAPAQDRKDKPPVDVPVGDGGSA